MSKTELFVRKTAGSVFQVVNETMTTGNIFYVDSGSATAADAGSNGKNPDKPFATLDYAIGKCTATNGDTIFVMPGHAENIVGASTLTLDVAGVKIIGLGAGLTIPTFTYTTAAEATFNITAANCHVENLYLYANYTGGVTAGVTVGADADGLVLKNIIMEEGANTTEFLIGVSVAAACHHVVIDGLKFYGVAGGTTSNAIIFVGASNFSIVQNCEIYGDFSSYPVDFTGAASTFITVRNNIIHNVDTSAGYTFEGHASTTGVAANNACLGLLDTVTPTAAAMSFFQNFVSNALGAQGIYKPAQDS
jgi:hypothetical protein